MSPPDFQNIHPMPYIVSPPISIHMKHGYLVVSTMGTKHKTVTNMLTSKHAATWCRYETYRILRTNELVPNLTGKTHTDSLVDQHKDDQGTETTIGCTSRLLTTKVGFSSVSNVDDFAKPQND